MVTACGIHYYQSRGKIKFLGATKDTSIQVRLPSDTGYINIVAALPRSHSSPLKEIVYDPTEVLIARPPASIESFWFWVLAFLLFIAVVVSIYLYKKKKKVETILNYELEDVRNVASVASPKKGDRNDPYAPIV